jgi:glycerol-3-phosphate acyltransferase PlsY
MNYALLLLLAYLVGSVPFGIIVGKLRGGVDPRKYGSGRMGMTNVMRTMGMKAALLVFTLDASKGVAAVLLARAIVPASTLAESLAVLASIVGHIWPVFARFRGGRGIAMGIGALLVMAPLVGGVALATFAAVLALRRYVSLASITAVSVAALLLVVFWQLGWSHEGYLVYAVAGAALLIWGHRDNIKRLREGREPRLGQRVAAAQGPTGRQ